MNKDSKIAILGYGIEGKAISEYLHEHGFQSLTICDERENLRDLPDHANVQLGQEAFTNLTQFEYIFRSPGISLSRPELKSAKESGVKFTSVTKFFFEKCPCPIIGISGTKGKGTTSALTFQILKNAGKDTYLGGNIGEAPTSFLDKLTEESFVILELSSFQLEDLEVSPHIAIVLNVTMDHLDYHATKEEYHSAKRALLKFQTETDLAIINQDYEGSRAFADLGKGKKLYYSRKEEADAYIKGKDLIVFDEKLGTTDDIMLRGTHNFENVLPACMTAKLLNVSNDIVKKTLNEFKGLPHRLELVAEKNGVKYYNDSFSTTPETSIAAVRAFTEPIYLIAGGSEKFSDFTQWATVCASTPNLKMVLLMGDTAGRMENELQNAIDDAPRETLLDIVRVKSLEEAFSFLSPHLQTGDIVLMSPACASFGLFENYKERGRIFTELARA